MTKHLLRRTIRTLDELREAVNLMKNEIWGLSGSAAARFGVRSEDFALLARFPKVNLTLDEGMRTAVPRLRVLDASGTELASHDDESLMRSLYPLRVYLPEKRYVLIPIYRAWVDAMLSDSGQGTPLKLRLDNAYYSYPKCTDMTRGDLVAFYEPKKEGGRGVVIGAAVVIDAVVDAPERLHDRFSQNGAYTSGRCSASHEQQGQRHGHQVRTVRAVHAPASAHADPDHLRQSGERSRNYTDFARRFRANPFGGAMSSAAILSIKPVYANQILAGTKTIELRKSSMNLRPDDVVLVYSSAPEQQIDLWFRVKQVETLPVEEMWRLYQDRLGIAHEDYAAYFADVERAVGLHVGEVHRLAPVSLDEIRSLVSGFVPPQGLIWLREPSGRYERLLPRLSCPLPSDVFMQQSLF
jgi:predicted transcriptional regulator